MGTTWTTENRCVACYEVLTRREEFYSNGCCPKCGYIGPSAVSIVQTNKVACRRHYHFRPVGWRFWQWLTVEVEYKSPVEWLERLS